MKALAKTLMTIDIFQHKKNLYSQNGEDGILKVLLDTLGIQNGYFVEFGAWDGKHWSNTYHCYEKGWSGCFIEGMEKRYADLLANVPDERVLKINTFIKPSGPQSLDKILTHHNVSSVDLLSIDIDSDDLTIWESIQNYHPAVVVIEYNSTIPFDTRYLNPPGQTHGNSALSITESANHRGYRLVEGTDTNLIFVNKDLISKTDIHCKSLQEIRDQTFHYRVFFGNDGTLLHDYKPFNDAGISEIYPIPFALSFGLQPVPRWLRKVRIRANYLAIIIFFFFAILKCPIQLFKLIKMTIQKLSQGKGALMFIKIIFDKDRMMKTLKK